MANLHPPVHDEGTTADSSVAHQADVQSLSDNQIEGRTRFTYVQSLSDNQIEGRTRFTYVQSLSDNQIERR